MSTPTLPAEGLPFVLYDDIVAVQTDVPLRFEIGLNGRGFMVDLAKLEFETLPQLRQAFDQGAEPGGQSRDTGGLWLRYGQDWSHGAGQVHFDRPTSDRARFHTSKGIDPWTIGQTGLLSDTEATDPATATNLRLLAVGTFLYKLEAGTLAFSSTGASGSWTSCSFTSSATFLSLTTDGVYVYVADGAAVFRALLGDPAFGTAWSTSNVTAIWFVNGRLLAAVGETLVELDGSGSPTTVLALTAGSTWNTATAASNGVYLASTAADVSQIWYVGVDGTTGALTVPVVAAAWLRGETVNVLGFYANLLVIGTSSGFRVGTITSNFIDYGQLTLIPGGVSCLAFENRYCWFGWSNYDTLSTGLGRIDLGAVVDSGQLLFAYASDLMVTGAGAVPDVARFDGRTHLAVAGLGFYRQADNLVPSGTLSAGQVSYNDVEDKLYLGARMEHEPLHGTIAIAVTTPAGVTSDIGSSIIVGATSSDLFGLARTKVPWLEPSFTLTRGTLPTEGPQLTLWQLRAMPTGARPEKILLPLVLKESVNGEVYNPLEVRTWLRGIQNDDNPVLLQLGSENLYVVIDSISMHGASHWLQQAGDTGLAGTLLVQLITIET